MVATGRLHAYLQLMDAMKQLGYLMLMSLVVGRYLGERLAAAAWLVGPGVVWQAIGGAREEGGAGQAKKSASSPGEFDECDGARAGTRDQASRVLAGY